MLCIVKDNDEKDIYYGSYPCRMADCFYASGRRCAFCDPAHRYQAAKFKSARIIFNGDITANKSLEFIDALDKLHYASPGLKEITLYINSYGGDMDSGYLLYQAIKNAAVPITAVNISMTASSATLMYCAAKKGWLCL